MLFEMTFVKQWTRCGYDYIICCCWSHTHHRIWNKEQLIVIPH